MVAAPICRKLIEFFQRDRVKEAAGFFDYKMQHPVRKLPGYRTGWLNYEINDIGDRAIDESVKYVTHK